MWGDHALLMTAKGAKSAEAITTPLVCGRQGDDYIIVASKGGAPTNPAWFGNLKADPEVEVEVANDRGTEKFKARARVVEDRAERDRLFKDMCKIWPSYADYEKRTDRLIPRDHPRTPALALVPQPGGQCLVGFSFLPVGVRAAGLRVDGN